MKKIKSLLYLAMLSFAAVAPTHAAEHPQAMETQQKTLYQRLTKMNLQSDSETLACYASVPGS